MMVLGIDPGSRFTGYGLVRADGSRIALVDEGRIRSDGKEALAVRLARLATELEQLVLRSRPDAVVLESPFFGVNARSLIVLAQARGAILTTLGRLGFEPAELTPAEVKRSITGNGRADKVQVARMVELLLALPVKRRTADATDALALAICYAQVHRMQAATRRSLERTAGALT
jgi:crossover junction endodeoxyribonuclease RuvC